MAKVTGDAEIGPVHRRHAKYPWDQWQNGEIWEIERGPEKDFGTSPRYMQTQLHVRARHIGRLVVTRVRDEKITFTFQKKDESEDDFRARTSS